MVNYHKDRAFRGDADERDISMTSQELIKTITKRIVSDFNPLRVIMFGSEARGEATAQSDLDFLVVMQEAPNKRQTAIEIRRVLSDLPVCKDIIVTTPEEIARRGRLVGTVLRSALREGKVLYERG
jgi:predicted nucleotidyltransferase